MVEDDADAAEDGDDALPGRAAPVEDGEDDVDVPPTLAELADVGVLPAPPGLGVLLEDGLLDDEVEDDAVSDGLAPTFSAVRSMVTGRFALPEEDAVLLPGLSLPPVPLPPDEDVPPGDFLSVVISSPPEPCRSQDLHYTHLFAKRYRRSKDFCALQKNDSPGSG